MSTTAEPETPDVEPEASDDEQSDLSLDARSLGIKVIVGGLIFVDPHRKVQAFLQCKQLEQKISSMKRG